MKDKRKIEILEMMLEKLNDEDYTNIFINYGDGLCMTTSVLKNDNLIYRYEETEIDEIINNSSDRRYKTTGYIYKPGSIPPRIKLLNRLINELKQIK